MENFITEEMRYEQAKKKAQNIKSFYCNLTCYCIVIPILIFINLKFVPQFQWFWFSMLGWGTGLLVHGLEAFQLTFFFSREWEEKKISKFMEEERVKQKNNNQL
ncbi:histidine kinase [Flavobacterium sp. NST-5]|uniref:Histidine kinase n=1 Tax=Flavobacterium ichthyis TaxID=2698827 RepID=A0ABW9Z984_9FLAO|nr:2TM domain-containing protein [Flavobacterium ichthyis]NBL65281.1 histidine kinase [Flavobacterium ichthyis]